MKLLVVLLLLSASQIQPGNGGSLARGILEPGGVFVGVDNVKIDASRSSLDEPIEVFVERVEDTSDLPPLSPSARVKAETSYYRFGAAETFNDYGGRFIIRVPLPDGISAEEGLAVFFFVPAERQVHQHQAVDYWASRSVDYFADSNEIAFPITNLLDDGTIFTIVSGAYGP